jgi:hypothetical protein
METGRRALVLTTFCGMLAGPAAAVSPGTSDTFEDGSTEGWSTGDPSPNPPLNIASGGPAGAGDNYLLLTASGVSGPGGKLVAWPGADFRGDYPGSGVTALAMDLNNFGPTTLSLRLYLDGPLGSTAVSTQAIVLAPGSGWTSVAFPMTASAFDGPAALVLGNVSQLRLYHGLFADYPGQNIAASLGVDNVTAVPEPALAWMLGAGLAALALMRRRIAC